jgi:hypothetical protein
MLRLSRILLAALLLAALFGATGLVLRRHEGTADFARARDRIERGEDPSAALAGLAAEGPREVGPYRLTRAPGGEFRLHERGRHGWREVR